MTRAVWLFCWSALLVVSSVRVIDGDTLTGLITIWPGLAITETIRVLGVDTPEMTGATRAAGEVARWYTTNWLRQAGQVRVWACSRDSFGRLLGSLTNERGEKLADALVESGNAVLYPAPKRAPP